MKSGVQHVVRRRLADGSVKEYRYARSKKPRVVRNPKDTLGGLIIDYKRSPEWRALRPATIDQYTRYLKSLEAIHQVKVVDVRKRDVLRIRNLIAEGRGNGAAQAFVRVAQALFTWAVEADLLETSPASHIKSLPRGSLRAWTAEEADYAAKKLPEELRRAVILARHTGQRRGDLCAMTWAAYDGQRIKLKQEKTGAELVVPCPRALRIELNRWRKDRTSTRILTTARGLPWVAQHMSMMLPRWLERIGMPDAKGLNVHGLRKLAAASLADAGCSTHEIMAITGHRTLAMVQHYTKTADQVRLAGDAISRLEASGVKRGKGYLVR